MSYIQDNLMPNERILYAARVHLAIFLTSIIYAVLTILTLIFGISQIRQVESIDYGMSTYIGVAFVILAFSFFLGTISNFLRALTIIGSTEFAITNRRVIAKTGFLRRHTLEIYMSKIESVAVRQGILDRMLNFGTVTITGTGGTKESFFGIIEPVEVRKRINQIVEEDLQNHSVNPQRPE
jgi:uncharacterized membrane protein YdbT with pleckstrin-like domain